jgi:hypothetical protein
MGWANRVRSTAIQRAAMRTSRRYNEAGIFDSAPSKIGAEIGWPKAFQCPHYPSHQIDGGILWIFVFVAWRPASSIIFLR